MTSPNEIKRRERLNRAIRRMKRTAYERRTLVYIVNHGKWAYHVTERMPRDPRNIVLWSNKGD